MKYGQKGILNKVTNATTNDIKKAEWDNICVHFNSSPSIQCHRDVPALQARYKKIIPALRMSFKHEKVNAKTTGGGPADRPPNLGIEVTGELFQLQQLYGHLVTGLPSFDCDNVDVNTEIGADEPFSNIVEFVELTESNKTSVLDVTCEDDGGNEDPTMLTVCDLKMPTSTVTSNVLTHYDSSTSAHESTSRSQYHNTPSTPSNKPSQYFPTNSQRRPRTSAMSSSHISEYSEIVCDLKMPTSTVTSNVLTHYDSSTSAHESTSRSQYHNTPSTPSNKPSQYFPTNSQRRPRTSAMSSSHISEYDEARLQLLQEERQRMCDLHNVRMQALQDESAARLKNKSAM